MTFLSGIRAFFDDFPKIFDTIKLILFAAVRNIRKSVRVKKLPGSEKDFEA